MANKKKKVNLAMEFGGGMSGTTGGAGGGGPYQAPAKPDQTEVAKKLLNDLVVKEIVADFSQVPVHVKLALVQVTPKKFIEERAIGGKTVHYVPHQYSKNILNFVFNFQASNEVSDAEYYEYDEKYKKQIRDKDNPKVLRWVDDIRHVIEAECNVKFTFKLPNGDIVIRSVHSSHKQYKNSAICRGDAMQAAISKAWTKVAATFGIGADLEDDFYKESKPVEQKGDAIEGEVVDDAPVAKTFEAGF